MPTDPDASCQHRVSSCRCCRRFTVLRPSLSRVSAFFASYVMSISRSAGPLFTSPRALPLVVAASSLRIIILAIMSRSAAALQLLID